ncbi:MAG: hypothetical protein EOP07_15775 [Proteobacteria bacterium]|nr:MAG: hypothetical protein EOP07_15775 [Pseudomonadota bacterium]
MNSKIKTFESFMDDALAKSLDDFTLEPTSAPEPSVELLKVRLCFSGSDMSAEAFLSCSRSFLQKTCPLPSGSGDHPTAILLDWLGELANLVIGRLKNRLLAHEITIKISPPAFEGNWPKTKNSQSILFWHKLDGSWIGFGVENGDSEGDDDDFDSDGQSIEMEVPAEVKAKIAPKDILGKPKHQPIRILFHSQSQAPQLTGLAWSQVDQLSLHFSSGLEYTICPRTLLEQGCSSMEVEGLVMTFQRDGDLIRASIPKYNMHLSKVSRVA